MILTPRVGCPRTMRWWHRASVARIRCGYRFPERTRSARRCTQRTGAGALTLRCQRSTWGTWRRTGGRSRPPRDRDGGRRGRPTQRSTKRRTWRQRPTSRASRSTCRHSRARMSPILAGIALHCAVCGTSGSARRRKSYSRNPNLTASSSTFWPETKNTTRR